MKYLLSVLSALAIAAALVIPPVTTPCASEDGTGCNWNASSRGNGKGSSFIAFTDEFRVTYATTK